MDKNMLKAICTAVAAGIVTGFLILVAGAASAGTAYTWTTADGVMEFTDDAGRIPGRYRNQAHELDLELGDYRKLTVSEPLDHSRRLEELRRFNWWYRWHHRRCR